VLYEAISDFRYTGIENLQFGEKGIYFYSTVPTTRSNGTKEIILMLDDI
jgi:hypothetical protein